MRDFGVAVFAGHCAGCLLELPAREDIREFSVHLLDVFLRERLLQTHDEPRTEPSVTVKVFVKLRDVGDCIIHTRGLVKQMKILG